MENQKMTPERWKQIDRLMDAAFEIDPKDIPQFLETACAGDESLREEMERLLVADQQSRSFIESRVLDGTTQSAEKLFPPLSESLDLASPFSKKGLLAERYQPISKLGKGGMGEVWHAYDVRLRVDVALKSLHFDRRKSPQFVEALRREVRVAREVISPNVCRIFDLVVLDQDQELISMEYIDGITLFHLLGQSGPLDLRQARDIAAQFLSGLEAIHQAGLVHRDLKPENIMITRTGRVVVMDFGVSQKIAELTGTISGTLPYMSPEQLSGSHIDGRSDVFSAGVVLAEMIHTKGVLSEKTRGMIWNAVRIDAQRIPQSPWKPVITRAVAVDPEERFQSVGALMRALEEVTQRIEGMEELRPYPGLHAFTTSEADYFFGRELEVETLLRKIQQFSLLAVVGPSGAGKTSFLRAGLLPVLPNDWCTVFATPGDAPILNLARGLSQSIGNVNQFEDPDGAVSAFQGLQQSRKVILLIIDRFEEVFTLNPPSVQAHYCNIIGRLSLEANIRVVLAMRDDFLMTCKDHNSLSPIFADLTAIPPLTGGSLRRALVQPALKCGYRFEDESMVDRILSDVENERGALPLIAFAAARMWEKRDQKSGLLTRQAYREIGGVTGAISQYAERILEQMNPDKQSIVREIFRHLVTAQNTRIARDIEDLLSVFPDRTLAHDVLDTLVDARLLTAFDAPSERGKSSKRRVEIIHESLLTGWPRLVRWQTQDVDSAQMRDQIRQAAQVWDAHHRSEDLLWTGTAFLEYQAWQQRYSGRLTAAEESFVQAMFEVAGRKRRQRRMALSTIVVVLLFVSISIGILWRNASSARDQAVMEARRAEAGRVIAVARALPDADPSTKLAYALRSLEFAENAEARQFALQAFSEGPAYHAMGEFDSLTGIQFSPDGKWLAAGIQGGSILLFPKDGSPPVVVSEPNVPANQHVAWHPQFSPESDLLFYSLRQNTAVIHVWSISQKKVIREFNLNGLTRCLVRGGKAFFITDHSGKKDPPFLWHESTIRVWDFGPGQPEALGQVNLEGNLWRFFDIDFQGRSIAYSKDNGVYVREFGTQSIAAPTLIGSHSAKALLVRFSPDGSEIASSDDTGEIRLWSLHPNSKDPLRMIPGTGQALFNLWFDSSGRSIMTARDGLVLRWDLTAPEEAQPFSWKGEGDFGSFNPLQRRFALSGGSRLMLYDDLPAGSYSFHGKLASQGSSGVRFTPDGKSFITGFSDEGLRLYRLSGDRYPKSQQLQKVRFWVTSFLDIDPSGRFVALPTADSGVHLIAISDSPDIQLKGQSQYHSYGSVAFSPDGKSVAAILGAIGQSGIELWDIATGSSRTINNGNKPRIIKFAPDGSLFSGDSDGNLRRWNPADDEISTVSTRPGKGPITALAISSDGRFVAAISMSDANSELQLYDLRSGISSAVISHGNRVTCVTFDRKSTKLVTGDAEGTVRVGPITGEMPILLLGHKSAVGDVAVHPDGTWILSSESEKPVIRLWRMPAGKPLQSLSSEEFQTLIRSKTNLRIIAEDRLPGGYGMELTPFTGW